MKAQGKIGPPQSLAAVKGCRNFSPGTRTGLAPSGADGPDGTGPQAPACQRRAARVGEMRAIWPTKKDPVSTLPGREALGW